MSAEDWFFMFKVATVSNYLDLVQQFSTANELDKALENVVSNGEISSNEKEVFYKVLSVLDEQDIDDGRFGMNDIKHPTVKAACDASLSFIKEGKYLHSNLALQAVNIKQADLLDRVPAGVVAETIQRLVLHLMDRANIKDRAKYLNSIRNGIGKINPAIVSQKRNNPTSAIGAIINIVKTLVSAQDINTVATVLSEIRNRL